MKNQTVSSTNFAMLPFGESHLSKEVLTGGNFMNFKQTTVPNSMIEQEIAPPIYVWERISNILDEQDRQKNKSGNLVAITMPSNKKMFRQYAVLSATVFFIATIIWLFY